MKYLFLLTLLLFCAAPSWAADVNAASCSDTDVQSAITTANAGDRVLVPAGSCTWTTTVTIASKALTLQGSGIGSTNITDQGASGTALSVTGLSNTHFVTITGFTFIKSLDHASGIVQIAGTQGTVAFRFHHNRILQATAGARGLYVFWVYGLVDHNTFDVTSSTGSIQSVSVDGASISTDGGYTPWTQALSFGTNQAVYFEDNTFTYGTQGEDAFDAYSGARLVFRHNTVSNNSIGFHGLDSGGNRSVFSVEMYGNTFTNDGVSARRAVTNRGGTLLAYDNTFGGSTGYLDFTLVLYRATIAGPYAWQYCNGTNWDIGSADITTNASRTGVTANTGARFLGANPDTICTTGGDCTRYLDGSGTGGYPCRDQQGRTHDQALAPLYEWNNGSRHFTPYDGGAPIGLPMTTWVLQNRDYYNYTVSFDGTVGAGRGTLASRPATCTTSAESGGGVAYWATDTSTLYRCSATNTWITYYTPYTYPHPLQGVVPAGLQGTVTLGGTVNAQ